MNRMGTPIVFVSLALAGCITMNPSVVEPEAYLGARGHAADVYESAGARSVVPVMDIRIDPMDGLFLVNFKDDPIYEGVELQTFPDPNGEPGVRVLLWRSDTVDV